VLASALSDDDNLNEILAASSAIAGSALDLDDAAPAAEAGIVEADLRTIVFGIRSSGRRSCRAQA
jgi:hypothetical protein